MIRSLLVPDFRLDSMIPVFGILVFTFLIQANMSDMLWKHHPYQPVVLAGVWGIGTCWGRFIRNDKWKAVSNGEEILLQNRIHPTSSCQEILLLLETNLHIIYEEMAWEKYQRKY